MVAACVLGLNFVLTLKIFHLHTNNIMHVQRDVILPSTSRHSQQQQAQVEPPPIMITLETLVEELLLDDLVDPELMRQVSNSNRTTTTTTTTTIEEASKGKEPFIRLLRDAGIQIDDIRVIQLLPTVQQVEQLYYNGKSSSSDGPRILGLAQCEQFRREGGQVMGIAGMFDSGTNLAAMYLDNNCIMPDEGREEGGGIDIIWQVPWGKHVVADMRKEHHMVHPTSKSGATSLEDYVVDHTAVMPIVMIRDPYFWMQSMCRHNYGAQWLHSTEHCPNLVPNDVDYKIYSFPQGTVPVRIKYDFGVRKWDSLAHLWTSWYQQYYKDADFPRLLVRFEDFIFYPKQVTQQICACAGGTARDDADFVYQVDSAKHGPGHGRARTSWVSAMIRYGSLGKHRLKGMTPKDLQLADSTFDLEMMQALYYQPSACC